MVDAVDDHEALRVIDLVDHAVRAAASRPQPLQFTVERPAHAMGVLQERAEHELHDRGSSGFLEAAELAIRRAGDAQFERLGLDHRFE